MGGVHGNHVLLDVRLVVSHDAVDHFLFRFTFEQGHGSPKMTRPLLAILVTSIIWALESLPSIS